MSPGEGYSPELELDLNPTDIIVDFSLRQQPVYI